jgi:hypothetical protein
MRVSTSITAICEYAEMQICRYANTQIPYANTRMRLGDSNALRPRVPTLALLALSPTTQPRPSPGCLVRVCVSMIERPTLLYAVDGARLGGAASVQLLGW